MSDRYKVVRLFPASVTLRRGQVLENPSFRNLALLVKQGYLEKVHGAARPSVRNEVPNPDVVEMADANRPDMIEVDKPHVEHAEATIEAPALPPDDVEVEVVQEAGSVFIPSEAAEAEPAPKDDKPATKKPAAKPKSKEKKRGK